MAVPSPRRDGAIADTEGGLGRCTGRHSLSRKSPARLHRRTRSSRRWDAIGGPATVVSDQSRWEEALPCPRGARSRRGTVRLAPRLALDLLPRWALYLLQMTQLLENINAPRGAPEDSSPQPSMRLRDKIFEKFFRRALAQPDQKHGDVATERVSPGRTLCGQTTRVVPSELARDPAGLGISRGATTSEVFDDAAPRSDRPAERRAAGTT
jgi:hypothetical protein